MLIDDVGLPAGTMARARGLAERGARARERLTGRPVVVDDEVVAGQVYLPWTVGEPPAIGRGIVTVPGGALQADLGPADVETFARLRGVVGDADPEALAAAAQEWRLPVTPYRPPLARRAGTGASLQLHARTPGDEPATRVRDPATLNVVDLTAMWAGPLCTALLAGLGAAVVKIEPRSRLDGLRGSPRQFATLNDAKQIVALDLGDADDRARFERLVRTADVVVESFSRRVMTNFGYPPEALRALNPQVVSVAVRAFPVGTPEQDWVAFGPGVHAASGHGTLGGRPAPAVVAYADALTGLAAFARVVEVLAADDPPMAVEVTLAETIHGLGPMSAADLDAVASGEYR